VRIRSPRAAIALLASLLLVSLPAGALAQSPAASPAAGGTVTVTDATGTPVEITDASRVVTLGGVITEIAHALGAGDQVVAVDASSFFPPEVLREKMVLPYYRMLAAEPVLAAQPTLIIGTDEVGPPEVVQQLRDAGITTLLLSQDLTLEGTDALITTIGQALGRDAEAADLVATVDAELAAAAELVAGATSSPKVMMVLLPPGAPLLVSGRETAAATMIGLAGATNAVEMFPDYIPLSPEITAAAQPDIILTTTDSLERAGGAEALAALPGIAETPAGASGTIVAMDDLYLLGFGPRIGQAVAELARELHPELAE
jgi:iron complex transport system substrate-binding protein